MGADSPEAVGKLYSWGLLTGYEKGSSESVEEAYRAHFGTEILTPRKDEEEVITGFGAPYSTSNPPVIASYDPNHPYEIANSKYDAAYQEAGEKLSIPDISQWSELFDERYTELLPYKEGDAYFVRVTSKTNGNSIVLPCGGWVSSVEGDWDSIPDNFTAWSSEGYGLIENVEDEEYYNSGTAKCGNITVYENDEGEISIEGAGMFNRSRVAGIPIRPCFYPEP